MVKTMKKSSLSLILVFLMSCTISPKNENIKRSDIVYFFVHHELGYSEVNITPDGTVNITDSLLNHEAIGKLDSKSRIIQLRTGKEIMLVGEYIKFSASDSCRLYPLNSLLSFGLDSTNKSRMDFQWRRRILQERDSIKSVIQYSNDGEGSSAE